jgi:hypothetical protein
MPTVQTYGPSKVSLEALPGVRKTAAQTPLSEGAGLAAAQAQTGQAIAGVGAEVAHAGTEFAAIALEEKKSANQTALLAADNQLSTAENSLLYDPETGALTVKGKAAMALPEHVAGQFNDVADKIAAGLSTDEQRAGFAKMRAQHASSLDLTLRRHVYGEMQAYKQAELGDYVKNHTNAAVAKAADPQGVGQELYNVTSAITAAAPKLGLGPEALQSALGAARTSIHVGVIDQLLTNNQDGKAKAYFDSVKPEIVGASALDHVEHALEEGGVQGDAQRASDKILAAGGTLTDQVAAARAAFPDDPKRRQATQALVEHNLAITDRAAGEQQRADSQQAYNIVEQTGRFDAIPAPLLTRLEGSTRSALRNYAIEKAKGVPVQTDPPTYYALMTQAGTDPATFLKQNVLDYRGKLDNADFKQLTDLQLTIRNGDRTKTDAALAGFRTNTQIIDDTLTQWGMDPKAAPDTDTGKAIAQLRRTLDQRIEAATAGTGKKATNVEIQTTLDNILKQSKDSPGSWWGLVPGVAAHFRDQTTRLIDIPFDERTKVEDALRRKGLPITDAAVLDLYVAGQNRGAK